MTIYNCDQGSQEWFRLRSGKPTASAFSKIIKTIGTLQNKTTLTYRAYLWKCATERILQRPCNDPRDIHSYFMEQGRKREVNAADRLEDILAVKLARIGIVITDDGRWGSSPDRLVVGADEVVEIKCPAEWNQARYLADPDALEAEYRPQIQGHLLVGGFEAVHLFCYHPGMPDIYRIVRKDKQFVSKLSKALTGFCKEIDLAEEQAREKWFNQRGEV